MGILNQKCVGLVAFTGKIGLFFLGRLRDSKWGEKLEGRWEEMCVVNLGYGRRNQKLSGITTTRSLSLSEIVTFQHDSFIKIIKKM